MSAGLPPARRRLASDEATANFSMDSFIKFHIVRGGEDSAALEDLSFVVGSAGIEDSLLLFKLDFDNPQKVSIGSQPDMAIATIVDGSFFADESTGIPIPPGTTIENRLPRMLPGEEFVMVIETTKETIETTAQGILVAQIIVTLILAVSLKSMWNLYNVIQILAYIRFFTGWPAFMMEIFMHMDNAVTLKPISDPMFEYGMSGFEKANMTLTDEGMRAMGVQDIEIAKSLGVFGFVLIGLGIAMVIYGLLKVCNIEKCAPIKAKLQKKLFFGAWLRYMIVSNLKITYTIMAFLLSGFSFATTFAGIKTAAFTAGLLCILAWPVVIAIFMFRNQSRLDEPAIKGKWETLYQGIHTDSLGALLYNAVFCVRRFDVVLVNMIFSPGFPLTNFDHHMYVFKNIAFLFIQSAYLIYIMQTRPHTRSHFNSLEFFNETLIILMCYIMLVFSGIGDRDLLLDSAVPLYISVILTTILIVTNIGVMAKTTVANMIYKWRHRKGVK